MTKRFPILLLRHSQMVSQMQIPFIAFPSLFFLSLYLLGQFAIYLKHFNANLYISTDLFYSFYVINKKHWNFLKICCNKYISNVDYAWMFYYSIVNKLLITHFNKKKHSKKKITTYKFSLIKYQLIYILYLRIHIGNT